MIISCLPWRSSTFKRIQDNHLHYKREFQSGMAIHFSETLQKRKKTSDLISSEMAGSSPSSRSPASHCGHITMATLLLVLMGCQQYAVFAAPVAHEAPLSDRDSSQTARKLLQWMLEHSFPTSSSALSSEVRLTPPFYRVKAPGSILYPCSYNTRCVAVPWCLVVKGVSCFLHAAATDPVLSAGVPNACQLHTFQLHSQERF